MLAARVLLFKLTVENFFSFVPFNLTLSPLSTCKQARQTNKKKGTRKANNCVIITSLISPFSSSHCSSTLSKNIKTHTNTCVHDILKEKQRKVNTDVKHTHISLFVAT